MPPASAPPWLASAAIRVQHAGAAVDAVLAVAVRVVHEHERDLHARAVDRPVLRVGDGHGERDVLPELEEVAVERRVDRDRRRRVADGDHRGLGVGLPARVGDGQPRRVDAVRRVGERRVRVDRVDGAVVGEVPREADRVGGIRVARALAREGHRQRRPPVGRRGAQHGLRRALALDVGEAVHARVRVGGEEAVAVGQQVEVAVGPDLQVHRVVALERLRRRADRAAVEQRVDLLDLAGGVEPDLLQVVARELPEQDRPVVVRRELGRARVGRVVVVLRRAVRTDAAGRELGPQPRARPGRRGVVAVEARRAPGGVLEGVPEVRVGDRRRDRPARVPARGVLRAMRRVAALVRLAERGRRVEVPLVVGEVGAVAERPAVVGRLADDLHPPGPGRPAERARHARVGRVVRHVGDVVLVDLDPERVPEAHRVDLGAGLAVGVLGLREQVAGRHRVGAVGGDGDPQQLAAQVVGVQRRAAGVEPRRVVEPALGARAARRAGRRAGEAGAVRGRAAPRPARRARRGS